jgi:Fe-S-cluster containining protein
MLELIGIPEDLRIREFAMKECQRCGKCCEHVGRNFWVHTEHPLVEAMIKRLKYDTDIDEPCDMLVQEDGKAVCLLQKYLGLEGKPDVCRDYPETGDKCKREQELL